jgi:hypothetical protein
MFGETQFRQAVIKAKRYITEGDVMQVVLSQRMSKPLAASPMALYRSLRSLNPSPYMFYFDFEDFHVVGASPEILVRLEGDTVTVGRSPAPAGAASPSRKIRRWPPSCWPTKRNVPSMSSCSTSAVTTPAASLASAPSSSPRT